MPDKFPKEVRSKIMSRIKSKWTSSERKVHNILKGNKVRHTMHPNLPGNPDVFLEASNTIIFIDGCFWHNCPEHGHIPKSNVSYWKKKIEKNVKRDLENTNVLQKAGFNVVRIWEHEVNQGDFSISSLKNKLQKLPTANG
jgi:DNA mismatch endonuclease (patch repair protein)